MSNALEAANYIGSIGADNGIDFHIDQALDHDDGFHAWRSAMPSRTPQALKDYKQRYPHYDRRQVDLELDTHGQLLPVGQELFHAGVWPGVTSFVTDRPLSTSFSPQVALRNAEHRGKAYDANRVDLFVLRVSASATKAYAFKRKGAALGHENEVLFAAGATLTLVSERLISSAHTVGKAHLPNKRVPLYVLERRHQLMIADTARAQQRAADGFLGRHQLQRTSLFSSIRAFSARSAAHSLNASASEER